MKIDRIEFSCSSPSLKICPKEEIPEFAFIGRSNVGKSSLINMLAGRKALAKVSGTPGKTRMINHFRVSSSMERIAAPFDWFLVDLPGYGFAKLSKSEREKFEGMIRTYLEKRDNLALTFLLVDARHEPQRIDVEFMNWLGDHEVAFIILFTKCDKLSKTVLQTNITAYKKTLSESWEELPAMVTTSAETKHGREEVLDIIGQALKECRP